MHRPALTLTLALGLISALGGTTLMAEKKGLTLYLAGGHTIALVVTEITPDVIKGRSQQFSEIQVLRRDVVAVAIG
jgi:hypothetical protein